MKSPVPVSTRSLYCTVLYTLTGVHCNIVKQCSRVRPCHCKISQSVLITITLHIFCDHFYQLQRFLRAMAARRGGTERVLSKLKNSIENQNYYEAHQMYRTLYFR